MIALCLPSETRVVRLGESESLYQDHDGHRVVADFEGQGTVRVLTSECELLDDLPPDAHFEDGLILRAKGPGRFSLVMQRGTIPTAKPIEVGANEFQGSGWVLAANGPVVIDDTHEWSEVPTPFWRSVRGKGLQIARAATTTDLLASFVVDDEQALRQRGFSVQNMSAVQVLSSFFPDGTEHTAPVASHLNAASWLLQSPGDYRGLIIRKTYDAFHGRQRARVLVNGCFCGWWYEPEENRRHRWRVSSFGFPLDIKKDQSLTITVDPPAGSPLWSFSEVQIFGVSEQTISQLSLTSK